MIIERSRAPRTGQTALGQGDILTQLLTGSDEPGDLYSHVWWIAYQDALQNINGNEHNHVVLTHASQYCNFCSYHIELRIF